MCDFFGVMPLFQSDETTVSSVQFKVVSMRSEKPIIMRSTRPAELSFPNVAFEAVPMCHKRQLNGDK